ncbi:MAG: D-hexose-6-phosphate mutarotase [Planctomycetes bacterium]|nr:D-hexose-6-phosphate mutarotase [Planctomycetota bacterium]
MSEDPRPPAGARSGRIDTGPGAGGLARLSIANAAAEAEVYLHGAHLCRWRPHGHQEVLWMSPRSLFRADKAIRGGVPICFPWFGTPADPALPAHGFARLREWSVERSGHLADGTTEVVLTLESNAATRALWPFDFRACFTVTIGATLGMSLAVENHSTAPIEVGEALHTYVAVGDVRRCTVLGLQGGTYRDKNSGTTVITQTEAALGFAGETDRVYRGTTAACTIVDPVMKRHIRVAKSGSDTTVVWNPWTKRAGELTDLGEDAWPGMLCVETANAGDDHISIAPGATHTMSAAISVALDP